MFDIREEIGMRSWRVRCGECTEKVGEGAVGCFIWVLFGIKGPARDKSGGRPLDVLLRMTKVIFTSAFYMPAGISKEA